jgi:hypothetical protein
MDLTATERDFLNRLASESWASPPLFDHELVAHLVELLELVETEPRASGEVEYTITAAGRAALS